jgi:peroxiredoxin
VIAVAPDAAADLNKMGVRNKLGFPLVGDGEFKAMDAFGIAWGKEGKKPLPTPAFFVIDGSGTIVFQYVNPKYSVSLHNDILLAVVRVYSPKKE